MDKGMRSIQMVVTSEEDWLFLLSFDPITNELVFRSSREPKYKQTENIVFKGDIVYTNLHYFHKSFLERITNANHPTSEV